ncbi:flagellin [Bacillus sp. ISL-78]|nr:MULTISPECIES: flagellin [unclassified Bacillus (in: firmicutes)]MBT2614108.1 flagellin [Bacillus sp. ISL-78]MBT2629381.1 flagellin [Bacillus sp. ISL-101]
MIINHNITALNTHRQLSSASNAQSKSMEKLASGMRINKAGDDAAGLAISEKMRGQIRGLDQASRNSQDGISMIQTAEGALNETHDILQRMRELAVQSSNDTNNDKDRAEIQKEISQLTEEIDRISNTTEFNTKKLLDGSLGKDRVATAGVSEGQANLKSSTANVSGVTGVLTNDKVGTHEISFSTGVAGEVKGKTGLKGDETLASLGITDIAGLAVGDLAGETTLTGLDLNSTVADLMNAISTQTNATAELVDGQLTVYSDAASATQLNIKQTTSSATNAVAVLFNNGTAAAAKASTNASATKLTIHDKFTDASGNVTTSTNRTGADGTGNITYNGLTIVKGTGNIGAADKFTVEGLEAENAKGARTDGSATLQIGANENQSIKIDIEDMSSKALGLNVNGSVISVKTATEASRAVTKINNAIETVSAERSKMGAVQNRLEHTINNLGTSSENLTAAESRIRDVDMAKEMMNQTKNSILSQAAQAMLAQANQQPQGVLQLLR